MGQSVSYNDNDNNLVLLDFKMLKPINQKFQELFTSTITGVSKQGCHNAASCNIDRKDKLFLRGHLMELWQTNNN